MTSSPSSPIPNGASGESKDEGGIWIVRAFNGRNLIPLDLGSTSDPYVKCGLLIGNTGSKRRMEKVLRCAAVTSNLNPDWRGWTYNVGGTGDETLCVQIWDYDALKSDDFMGEICFTVNRSRTNASGATTTASGTTATATTVTTSSSSSTTSSSVTPAPLLSSLSGSNLLHAGDFDIRPDIASRQWFALRHESYSKDKRVAVPTGRTAGDIYVEVLFQTTGGTWMKTEGKKREGLLKQLNDDSDGKTGESADVARSLQPIFESILRPNAILRGTVTIPSMEVAAGEHPAEWQIGEQPYRLEIIGLLGSTPTTARGRTITGKSTCVNDGVTYEFIDGEFSVRFPDDTGLVSAPSLMSTTISSPPIARASMAPATHIGATARPFVYLSYSATRTWLIDHTKEDRYQPEVIERFVGEVDMTRRVIHGELSRSWSNRHGTRTLFVNGRFTINLD